MQKLLLILIMGIFCGCKNNSPDAAQLIKEYYKKEEGRDGGSHIYLKEVKILNSKASNDTIIATAAIKGTYSPNQVPDASSASSYTDTLYWKFYKVNGEWESHYNGRPW
jgi:hypothetical protein